MGQLRLDEVEAAFDAVHARIQLLQLRMHAEDRGKQTFEMVILSRHAQFDALDAAPRLGSVRVNAL